MRIELSVPLSTSEIIEATGAKSRDVNEQIITHISTDSREVMPDDLFVAIKGNNFDGEDYVDTALNRGATPLSTRAKDGVIVVSDTRAALLSLASYYIKKLPYIIYKIAITGSVGKTTTKEFLKVLLSEKYKTHASAGNLNNEIGMPLSVLSAPKDSEVIICEMGMNHTGEISKMAKALEPDIALITNVGTAHIGNLGSRENIARAKLEVLDGMKKGVLIVPSGEPLLRASSPKYTLSIDDKSADFHLSNEDGDIVFYKNKTRVFARKFAFSDEHLLYCLCAAISISALCNLDDEHLNRGISLISHENIRQKIISRQNIDFFVDCYNASEESVLAALKSLFALSGYDKKSAVLGDILELGEHSRNIHYRIGERICDYNLRRLYLFGKESASIRDGAIKGGFPLENIFYNSDATRPDITASQIKENSASGEIILLKGSRGMRLERILDLFDE